MIGTYQEGVLFQRFALHHRSFDRETREEENAVTVSKHQSGGVKELPDIREVIPDVTIDVVLSFGNYYGFYNFPGEEEEGPVGTYRAHIEEDLMSRGMVISSKSLALVTVGAIS